MHVHPMKEISREKGESARGRRGKRLHLPNRKKLICFTFPKRKTVLQCSTCREKKTNMKKQFRYILSGLLAVSLFAGCAGSEKTAEETPEATPEVIAKSIEPASASANASAEVVEYTPVDANSVSYEMLQNYAGDLRAYLDQLTDFYQDGRIPKSKELEDYFAELYESLDKIEEIKPNEITEEDCRKLMEELRQTEKDLDDCLDGMNYMAEDAPTQETLDTVKFNYQALIGIYNDLAAYFSQDGAPMDADQRLAMNEARRRVDAYDDIYFDGITSEKRLNEYNEMILEDIDFLGDIGKTI